MKQRSPVYVSIASILTILLVVYYMFVQEATFLSSPYFWGTVVISIILAMIHHAIGDLIENDQFKKLTDAEKAEYIEVKKEFVGKKPKTSYRVTNLGRISFEQHLALLEKLINPK